MKDHSFSHQRHTCSKQIIEQHRDGEISKLFTCPRKSNINKSISQTVFLLSHSSFAITKIACPGRKAWSYLIVQKIKGQAGQVGHGISTTLQPYCWQETIS